MDESFSNMSGALSLIGKDTRKVDASISGMSIVCGV